MHDEERRQIRKEVITLTWPVVLQNVFRTAMFYVDTIMLGHMTGAKARHGIAVMGVCGPIIYTLVTILNGLSVGTLAIVARSTGAGDREEQEVGAANALMFAVAVGVVATVAGVLFLPSLVHLFEVTGSPETTAQAAEYVLFYAWVILFMIFEIVISSIFRAAGDTRTPMIVAVIANVMNVFGNYALIYGHWGFPEMGVRGAALSTAVSYIFEGTVLVGLLFSPLSPIRLRMSSFVKIGAGPIKRFVRVTLPALVEPIILQSGFLVFIGIVNHLGELSLAAHRIAIAVESASFLPLSGFAIGCAALVGQSLGARRPDRAEAYFRETLRLLLYFIAFLVAVFAFFPDRLIWLFIPNDPEVIALGAVCLLIAAIEQPVMALAVLYGGALRGAGDTVSPVGVAIAGVWMVRVPLSYFLGITLGWGLTGIWLTMIIDWSVRALIFGVIYGKGKWKTLKI